MNGGIKRWVIARHHTQIDENYYSGCANREENMKMLSIVFQQVKKVNIWIQNGNKTSSLTPPPPSRDQGEGDHELTVQTFLIECNALKTIRRHRHLAYLNRLFKTVTCKTILPRILAFIIAYCHCHVCLVPFDDAIVLLTKIGISLFFSRVSALQGCACIQRFIMQPWFYHVVKDFKAMGIKCFIAVHRVTFSVFFEYHL